MGLTSDSPHTNGYSLIRLLLERHEPDTEMLEFLLTPHRCYLGDIERLQRGGFGPRRLAHTTGGGVIENLPRVLPDVLSARIDLGAWQVPQAFRTLVQWAGLSDDEAFRVWNMGIGMIVVVDRTQQRQIGELGLVTVGHLVTSEGSERVRLDETGVDTTHRGPRVWRRV